MMGPGALYVAENGYLLFQRKFFSLDHKRTIVSLRKKMQEYPDVILIVLAVITIITIIYMLHSLAV